MPASPDSFTLTATLPPNAQPAAALRGKAKHYWLTRSAPLTLACLLLLMLAQTDMQALTLEIQSLTRKLPDTFWSSVTLLGHGSVLLALLSLTWKKRPDWIIAGICAAPIAGLYSRLLKQWIGGPRPASILPADQLHIIGERLMAGSFPSGHTTTAFLLAGVIMLSGCVPRKLATLALVLAVCTGLSRIAVGAHWPVDVIAGAAGGWLSAAIGVAIMQHSKRLHARGSKLAIALIILGASIALLFTHTGYPLGQPFQYLAACIGIFAASSWAIAEWRTAH